MSYAAGDTMPVEWGLLWCIVALYTARIASVCWVTTALFIIYLIVEWRNLFYKDCGSVCKQTVPTNVLKQTSILLSFKAIVSGVYKRLSAQNLLHFIVIHIANNIHEFWRIWFFEIGVWRDEQTIVNRD